MSLFYKDHLLYCTNAALCSIKRSVYELNHNYLRLNTDLYFVNDDSIYNRHTAPYSFRSSNLSAGFDCGRLLV